MNSKVQNVELDYENLNYKVFDWNDEVNFVNIISALFNNWPEMKLVVDCTSDVSRSAVDKDIRNFIQNVFDCILIYGTGCNDQVSDNIKKGMTKDFNMVIEDFSAKEMSTRICNMYDKWINRDNLNENRRQIIEEIKKLPKSYPIIEFEDISRFKLIFDTDEEEEIMC